MTAQAYSLGLLITIILSVKKIGLLVYSKRLKKGCDIPVRSIIF